MRVQSLLLAALIMVLAACSQDPEPTAPEAKASPALDNALLGYVPADTPYYLVGGEDTPQEVIDKISAMYEGMWGAIFEEAMADYEDAMEDLGDADVSDEGSEQMEALARDMMQRIEDDGLAAFGLDYRDDMVIYGRGILPVLRINLSYPDKLRELIAMVEGHLGAPLPVASHNGTEYWRFESDDVVGMFGLKGNMLAATFAPTEQDTAALDHLFGEPTSNPLSADEVLAIANKYDFTTHAIAMLDTVDMARRMMAMDPNDPLYEVFNSDMDLDPACRDEILGFVSKAPRMVAGYSELSVENFGGSFIIELESSLANDLSGLAVPLPGLGQPSDAPVSVGFAMDLAGASRMARDWMMQAANQDFACEELASADFAGQAQQVNPAALGMMGNPKGVFISLDNRDISWIDDEDFSNASMTISALFENPSTVMFMAQTFIPPLQDMDIQPNGEIFTLDIAAMAESAGEQVPPELSGKLPEVFGVMTERTLAVASGDGAESRLNRVLNAPEQDDPPILYYQVDMPWIMDVSKTSMEKELAELRAQLPITEQNFDADMWESMTDQQEYIELQIEVIENQIDFSNMYGQVMGNTEFAIRFTSDGIRMDSVTKLP